MKRIQKNIHKIPILFIAIVIIAASAISLNVNAAGLDFSVKMKELQAKYPNGKYWNHAGMTTDNSEGYTDTPCTCHKQEGYDCVYGTGAETNPCTCNHFADVGHLSATQCMGFANKLGHEVFGDTTWTRYDNPTDEQVAGIVPGDIIRINYHSAFVISRNGNIFTVVEANYPNSCQIRWNGTYTLPEVKISYFEHAANYDTILGSGTAVTPASPTTEQSATDTKPEAEQPATTEKNEQNENDENFTGIKKTASGDYRYYKNGKLQKNKWVSYKGNNYYVAANGYILKNQWLYKNNVLVYVKNDGAVAKNELVKIGSNTYYFNGSGKRSKGFKKVGKKYYYCNNKGIVQKKKWIKQGGKSYYVQKDGVRAAGKLVKIGKYQYYFNEKGVLQKNKTITYQEEAYKADKLGHCKPIPTATTDEDETDLSK